ncbi:DUF2130 domain-containing protein [Adlercreutzia sp. ZJ304]|uniref:DUF2130 domain-containing protein n=1 Tax=Adlercreutzia sp. ZJ304 TaxID=2709791 RepID=UPI0013EC1185|nr:DUF2130 domain-containing protein [Adlercreutzia sp. ZJ304]
MNQIKCPRCGEVFTVDESGYAEILKQVRDSEFRQEIERQTAMQQEQFKMQKQLSIQKAKQQIDLLTQKLEAQEAQAEAQKQLAIQQTQNAAAEAARAIEHERDELAMQIERERAEAERAAAAHELELASKLQLKDEIIATREREIEDMRHMRAETTVKMLGESLEQYCENEFNKLRATGFQSAQFGKDNDASEGTKGDYIYRELDANGDEIVSIMFEMKTEADDSVHKKRNEDHFKKLDSDRHKKGCEYAVLVSLLERDSDYYNTGIVDVSYASGFEKMYVIRPQFFIPLITLIRNAALKSMDYRHQLAEIRQQNIDVTNFEQSLEDFKSGFGRNCELASRKFQDAIKDIDATIKKLEKIKDELTSSDRNMQQANKKLEGLTVKRLTRKNPTMKAAFELAAGSLESAE